MKDKNGILQSSIQFKGGVDELEDFAKQISNNDPSFDSKTFLKQFGIDDTELTSEIIHLYPFNKKLEPKEGIEPPTC